jgi:hypothetical protein
MMTISNMTAQSIVHGLIRIIGIVTLVSLPFLPSLGLAQEDAPAKPKTPRMTCGKCEEGYVTTGRTTDAKICPDDDHTLVECVPPGIRGQMSVCGSCPESYLEIGRSQLPALCGSVDGGLRTQCQLPKLEGGMPDPTQGGRQCPPDCAGNLPSGMPPGSIDRPGKLPPPPKAPE